MKYFRTVLISVKSDMDVVSILNTLKDWECVVDIGKPYKNLNWDFYIRNEKKECIISFEKISDFCYKSVNVFPYKNGKIGEEELIHTANITDDVLFALSKDIKKTFVDYELLCGIIPDVKD